MGHEWFIRRKIIALVFFLLLGFPGRSARSHHHPGWPYGYRIHSANVLQSWSQLLRKGCRSFQVHPYFVSEESICSSNGASILSGSCFLLTPISPLRNQPYDTLSNLVSLVKSSIFLQDSREEEVTITLYFQNGPKVCSGVSPVPEGLGVSWLSLIDTFKHDVSGVKGINWVLDGDALPLGCLKDQWRPWPAAFTTVKCPRDALTLDDKPLDRFQLLSDPPDFSLWNTFASEGVNYGKFDKKKLPYVISPAPNDQLSLAEFMGVYEGGKPHSGGLDFSIDFDPAMFEVYVGVSTPGEPVAGENSLRRGISVLLSSPLDIQNNTKNTMKGQKIVPISGNPEKSEVSLLQFFFNDASFVAQNIHVVSATKNSPPTVIVPPPYQFIRVNTTILNSSKNFSVSALSSEKSDNSIWLNKLLLLSNAFGAHELFNVSLVTTSQSAAMEVNLTKWASSFAPPRFSSESPKMLATHLISRIGSEQGDTLLIAELLGEGLDTLCHPRIQFLSVEQGEFIPMARVVCLILPERDPSSLPKISSGAISVAKYNEQRFLIVAVGSTVGNLYVGTMALDQAVQSDADDSYDFGGVKGLALRYAGAGEDPHFSVEGGIFPEDKEKYIPSDMVLLVSGGGYCFDISRLRDPNGCHTIPTPTPFALDYSISTLEGWLSWLSTPSGPITPCDPIIYHGSYDRGTCPSSALFRTSEGKLALVSTHLAPPDSSYYDQSGYCGKSRYTLGFVLDSFLLPLDLLEPRDASIIDGYETSDDFQNLKNYSTNSNFSMIILVVFGVVMVCVLFLGVRQCSKYRRKAHHRLRTQTEDEVTFNARADRDFSTPRWESFEVDMGTSFDQPEGIELKAIGKKASLKDLLRAGNSSRALV